MSAVEILASASPAKGIPSGEELVQRARALAPKLKERAVEAERERNIPLESVEEYIQAGLLRTIMPKRWGGYEHDHEVQFNVAIELGRSTCGSSACA
jgi:3-hydroxy-9,10-secoandrosta-1,3,5(10)-triene-9,17-dione monooxygenase